MGEEIVLDPWIILCGLIFGGLTLYLMRKYLRGPKYKGNKRLDGKTVIVTGATGGIGFELTKDLCRRGARVLMLCRNKIKATAARRAILQDLDEEFDESDRGQLVLMYCDLAEHRTVRECARKIMLNEPRLDLLILNAGVMMTPYWPRTADNFETQLGVNHMGHFILTRMLIPLLISTSREPSSDVRVVIVSSESHRFANDRIKLVGLNWEQKHLYSPSQGYFHSKLANVLFGRELGRILEDRNITVASLHPGVVSTDLSKFAGVSGDPIANLFYFNHKIFGRILKQPVDAIQTILYCCLDEEVKGKKGAYFKDCREVAPSRYAQIEDDATGLWTLSVRFTDGLNFVPEDN